MTSVTIGMPAHNDAAFVAEALESLLAQRYGDFVLHISDDASTDGTEDICRRFARSDDRIVYERQSENLGIARNMALLRDRVTTEYFAWAADDDLWHPDFLGTLLTGLEASPTAVVAFCPVRLIDEDGTEIGRRSLDLADQTAFGRLSKLTRVWDDHLGYGLFRSRVTAGMRFPKWWGPNRDSPYNVIYPSLYFALASGDVVLCGDEPLWSKRSKSADSMTYERHLHRDHLVRGVSLFWLRKLNVWYECISQTREAGGARLAARVAPALGHRLCTEVARMAAAKAVKTLRGEATFW